MVPTRRGLRRAALLAASAVMLPLATVVTASPAPAAAVIAPPNANFQKVPLDTSTSNPMMLDIAADGRVFYIDRLGDVKVIKAAGGTVLAGHLGVYTGNESGLLAIALDPNFATNHWVFVYYSPSAISVDRLSRFTVTGDSLNLSSEKVVLDVPVQRAQCCHHGAGLVIDKKTGNLWLSPGDNTNPFASDGYTPIDERPGRAAFDAQRTAGNTNSLSGKVLRIHPKANGGYTIPSGNLFPPGTPKARPEIYLMGERNPFRIGLDPQTGSLLVGNFGPDAASANPTRGPKNTVEWDIVSKPGNAGWPYCVGPNTPYIDYNFATATSTTAFDCAGGPTNNSPNNTGLTKLPPALPATVWYHYTSDPAHFPQLVGGGPIAGPVYRFDPNLVSNRKWPADFNGRAIFGEWTQNKLFTFQLAADSSAVTSIDRLLPAMTFLKPMDLKYGPDGALYMIEWGSGFGGDNADSGIYRIDYVTAGALPIAKASADHTNGLAPLTVAFSSAGSSDPNNLGLNYGWTFGDGGTSKAANPTHTYTANGNFTAILTVTNSNGKSSTTSIAITVGNRAPKVTLTAPPNGGFFMWGDKINYSITVTDPDDGAIDCGAVQLQAILGHDTHGHPLDVHAGCKGTVQTTTLSAGHSDSDNLFYVLEASYTDKGGAGGSSPLTARSQVILQPKHKQAEFFSSTGRTPDGKGNDVPGVTVENGADIAGGGQDIGFIQDGDWWSVEPAALANVSAIRLRAASAISGGVAQVRWNSPTGTLLGSATIPGTGGWQSYTDVTINLGNPPTTGGKLYFVAHNPASAPGYLFNVNWMDFIGPGVGVPATVISLKAKVNGKYVTAENAGAKPLIANRTAIGPWEQFDQVDAGGGMIALLAHANGKYVTAENAGKSPLIANRYTIGSWEKFTLVNNPDGSVSLKANVNGQYVTAESAGASWLIANRSAIGLWEKFDLITG